jgi:hypothetical protein
VETAVLVSHQQLLELLLSTLAVEVEDSMLELLDLVVLAEEVMARQLVRPLLMELPTLEVVAVVIVVLVLVVAHHLASI